MYFTQQDIFIIKSHYRNGVRNQNGEWTYSVEMCKQEFREMFPLDFSIFGYLKVRGQCLQTTITKCRRVN